MSYFVTPDDFIHPSDRAALNALESIPGSSTIMKKVLSVGIESFLHGVNMASAIRLSYNQLPDIYAKLPPICNKLGIPVPELYLEMNPFPNACTFGDTQVFIKLTSGLLECMKDEELDCVIAHECGHILCRHVLYSTVANTVKNFAAALGLLGSLITPIEYALFYWYRMSELSCDRAAAIITSPKTVAKTMARLSGGPKSITEKINFMEWALQAEEYEKIKESGLWNKTLQTIAVMDLDHPFSAVRVKEIHDWSKTAQYRDIRDRMRGSKLLPRS